jgi:hypothetical protein
VKGSLAVTVVDANTPDPAVFNKRCLYGAVIRQRRFNKVMKQQS